MSGVAQYTQTGPQSYSPADGTTVTGGRLVEGTDTGRIRHAAAGSARVLGAAVADAIAPEQVKTTPDAKGNLAAVVQPTSTAVDYSGTEVKLTYTAAAKFGETLVAAADGKVAPGATNVVARCTEPAGVAANGVGLARLA